MSDSTQQYILKQPAEASYYEEGLMAVEFEDISECLIITDEQFENTFVPLDIPSIEKQLNKILGDFRGAHTRKYQPDGTIEIWPPAFDPFITQIKALFGLEGDTKDGNS